MIWVLYLSVASSDNSISILYPLEFLVIIGVVPSLIVLELISKLVADDIGLPNFFSYAVEVISFTSSL